MHLACVMLPDTRIEALPHPRFKGEEMPFFDEKGRAVRSATMLRFLHFG